MKLNKDEGVGSFFTKIAQVRDQLIAIGITVDDDDLVQTVFDGLSSSWETFMASLYGRENQPTFERIWHDCIQEEARNTDKVIKGRNLGVSFLTCLRLNVILVTNLDIMLEITGRTRRNPREGFRHMLQKQRKKKMKNQRRRRKPRLIKLMSLEESTI